MTNRILPLLLATLLIGAFVLLFTYDIIKIDWVSMMEIQPSYKPMEDPLPVPARSIPIQGAAFVPGTGAPENPVPADEVSLTRGEWLYGINCAMCHGAEGLGNGTVGSVFTVPPANLTTAAVQNQSDGALFLTITNGFPNRMPPLNENLEVRDRWDVVNYVRTLVKE